MTHATREINTLNYLTTDPTGYATLMSQCYDQLEYVITYKYNTHDL